MSRSCSRGIAFRDWPEVDRDMWTALVCQGDPFDGSGPLAQLRPASLETLKNSYGFFLAHAIRMGCDEMDCSPADRVTPEMLQSYHDSLKGLAPRTRAGYFAGLANVMTAAFPERGWQSLRSARNNLLRLADRAGPARSKAQLPISTDLVAFARELLEEADTAPSTRRMTELYRDGLVILMLAYHPLRIANFAELELGRTLRKQGKGYRVDIPATEAKQRRPIEFSVGDEVLSVLSHYLQVIRPHFPGGETPFSGRLWLRFTYGPWEKKSIGRHISRLCEARFKRRITPHMFRDAAATTVAVSEDADARIIRPLLTHVRPETSEKHYIQAGQLEVSRRYAKALALIQSASAKDRKGRSCPAKATPRD